MINCWAKKNTCHFIQTFLSNVLTFSLHYEVYYENEGDKHISHKLNDFIWWISDTYKVSHKGQLMEYNEAKGPMTLFNIARQAPPFSRPFIIVKDM